MFHLIPLMLMFPSCKLFCFLIPCATLLGMLGVYLGGLFSYFNEVATYSLVAKTTICCVATVTNMCYWELNLNMATDEEKSKIVKLLQGLEVPEVKLTERCSDLVKNFHQRFGGQVEAESQQEEDEDDLGENPYRVDRRLLEENERKLRELLAESKRAKKDNAEKILAGADPKRPWRINSNKEKLLRVDSELKRHLEKSSQAIVPLAEQEMQELVKECKDEGQVAPAVGANRLRDTVDAAKKNLPHFQYKKISNSTATSIMPLAHAFHAKPSTPKDSSNIE